jgi:hypothetical protein
VLSRRPAICSGAVVARDLDKAAALELVLEQFALGLGALQDGVGMAERIGERLVGKVMEREGVVVEGLLALAIGSLLRLGLEPRWKLRASPLFVFGIPYINGKVN